MLVRTRPGSATVRLRCFTYDPWPIVVVGSVPELGNWDPKSALPMQLEAEVDGCREWTVSLECPPGQAFEFKFVAKAHWGLFWEAGENRTCSSKDRWTGVADAFREWRSRLGA